MSEATAAELTRRLAAGEEKAFCEFHEIYFDRIYHFLLAVTRGDEHEAQEALQETLLRVARNPPRVYEDEEKFWRWLKAVARNAARDGWRKRRRYLAILERFSLRWGGIFVSNADAAETRLLDLLSECLGELSQEERALIEGKYFDGAAVAELSSNSGLTEKSVESRLHRLRAQLRERLIKKLKEP